VGDAVGVIVFDGPQGAGFILWLWAQALEIGRNGVLAKRHAGAPIANAKHWRRDDRAATLVCLPKDVLINSHKINESTGKWFPD
jgi:hypothetical protein